MDDLNRRGTLDNVIKDAIAPENNFAEASAGSARIRRPDIRKGAKDSNVIENSVPNSKGRIGIIRCNIGANLS